VVVPDGNTLTGEVPEVAAIDFVPHQQHDTLASSAKFPLLNEEGVEVMWAEGFPFYAAAALWCRRAAHKFDLGFMFVMGRSGEGFD
jgi:hypothetical protein